MGTAQIGIAGAFRTDRLESSHVLQTLARVPGETKNNYKKTIQKSRIPGEAAEARHFAVAIASVFGADRLENSHILRAST